MGPLPQEAWGGKAPHRTVNKQTNTDKIMATRMPRCSVAAACAGGRLSRGGGSGASLAPLRTMRGFLSPMACGTRVAMAFNTPAPDVQRTLSQVRERPTPARWSPGT